MGHSLWRLLHSSLPGIWDGAVLLRTMWRPCSFLEILELILQVNSAHGCLRHTQFPSPCMEGHTQMCAGVCMCAQLDGTSLLAYGCFLVRMCCGTYVGWLCDGGHTEECWQVAAGQHNHSQNQFRKIKVQGPGQGCERPPLERWKEFRTAMGVQILPAMVKMKKADTSRDCF
eukprot:1156789-Pelagomonas_calceolata.AAC.6